jgi:hypothetical protein
MGQPFWRLSWAVKDPEKLENVPGALWALELGLPDVVAGAPEKNGGPSFCMVGGAPRIVDPLISQRWLTGLQASKPG